MNTKRLLALALLLLPSAAFAQSAGQCPELPPGTGLAWDAINGPDFLYCKAMRDGDGSQAFAVMLREDASFRERYSLREEEAVIDGHEVRWYRGDVAAGSNEIVRETLIELDGDLSAHIVLRATSEEQRAENQRLAEGLRFPDTVAIQD